MYKNLVLVDGEIMPAEEAAVSVHDRGHQFGDGVFEIVPVYNGRCFALLPHMDNLFESVIKVKIPAVYTIEELIEFHKAAFSAFSYLTVLTNKKSVKSVAFTCFLTCQNFRQPV